MILFCLIRCSLGPVAESPKSSPASISALKEKIKSPFGKGKGENTRKIQLMLEETLTKNVQLQRVRKLKILRVCGPIKVDFFGRKLCCTLFFPYNIYLRYFRLNVTYRFIQLLTLRLFCFRFVCRTSMPCLKS